MAKYIKKYSFKGYKIKETADGSFDIFKPDWDPNEPVFEELSSIDDAKEWILSDIALDENHKIMKENAVKEYAKKFKMICEYGFNTRIEEEGEPDPNAQPDPNADAQAVDPNTTPPVEGEEVPNMEDTNSVPPVEGEDSQYEDIEMEDDETGLQPGDNVIDVSKITDGQEETKDEMQNLKDKFEELVKLNDKVTQTLDRIVKSAEENKNELQSVKTDLAQRIPTDIEKLKGRTTTSGPYNQTVDDYWRNRPGGDKYDIYPDDKDNEEKEYILRKSDIENINPQTVYNSFNQKLRDIVGF